jgi:hypothetical protein
MGRSFVTTDGEHGFWMRDTVLEVWLRFLALHIREPDDTDSVQTHEATKCIRDRFLLASTGYFVGCVPHGLEEVVATTEGATLLRSAVESLLQGLESAPKELSIGVLSLMGLEIYGYPGDFGTWRLIEVAHAFLALLDGKITATASSTEFMPGCRY